MMDERIVHIRWEGPLTQDVALQRRNDKSDYGIYQIYGPHPVYGPNVMLYIGKAREQTFGDRLKQHLDELFCDSEICSLYLGCIAGEKTPALDTWRAEIDKAERLLIYSHIPAYNSQSIADLDYESLKGIRVINLGNRGSLSGDVTGYRWWAWNSSVKPYGNI